MKNLVALFAVLFLFAFTSCSDVNDNSLLTNPVMEKPNSIGSVTSPSPVYPYPYLFNFSNVEDLKSLTLEGENAIQFYMPEGSPKYVHVFVVVNYLQGIGLPIAPKMFFIDNITNNSFKVEGVTLNETQKVSVYGLKGNSISGEVNYPFTNNSAMNEVAVSKWKVDNSQVLIECTGTWPSSLKFVFAEMDTKYGSFLVFLQRPYSSNFVIPEYGKYGVKEIKLFGNHSVMEGDVASF